MEYSANAFEHRPINTVLYIAVPTTVVATGSQVARAPNNRASSDNRAALFARAASAEPDSQHESQHRPQHESQHEPQSQAPIFATPNAATCQDVSDRRTLTQTSCASVTGPEQAVATDRCTQAQTEALHVHTAQHSAGSMQSSRVSTAVAHGDHQALNVLPPQDSSDELDVQFYAALASQTPADPPLGPTSSCTSESSLSLPHQDSAQYGTGPKEASFTYSDTESALHSVGSVQHDSEQEQEMLSGDEEAESARAGDLNTPEQKRQSARAFNEVILELRQQHRGSRQNNDSTASAASSVLGKLLTRVLCRPDPHMYC